jgi:hypothetical protein
MKKYMVVMAIVMTVAEVSLSQGINWRSLHDDQRNVIQLNFGYDYGVTTQFGYSRAFTIVKPVLVGIDYSFPMGDELLDDFKVRIGGQVEIVQIGGFSATARIMGSFRRYQNQLVRIASFGSDFAILAGYSEPTWSVTGEFGFDKSITSYVKHSDVMRTAFPAVKDGWYIPTGGHYYYGVQAGKTIGETYDVTLRLGATNAQDNDEDAMIAYYIQVGVGMRF